MTHFGSENAPFDIPSKLDLVVGFTFKRLLFDPALHGICYTLQSELLDAISLGSARSLFAIRRSQSGYSTVLEKAEASVTGAIKIGQGH
jgi:hypothetical protein